MDLRPGSMSAPADRNPPAFRILRRVPGQRIDGVPAVHHIFLAYTAMLADPAMRDFRRSPAGHLDLDIAGDLGCGASVETAAETLTFDMDTDATEALIRSAAEETLRSWSEAEAAVLFGSRGRGDHQPDSDWDIVFVTMPGTPASRRLDELPVHSVPGACVEAQSMPRDLLERRAGALGSSVHAIVREGRLIAGTWDRPTIPPVPAMDSEEFRHLSRLVNESIVRSAGQIHDSWSFCPLCLVCWPARGVEAVAKIALARRGIYPRRVHDLPGMADDLAVAAPELAHRLRVLDERLQEHRKADIRNRAHDLADCPVGAEDCRIAVQRLVGLVQVWGRELEDTARGGDDLAAAARAAAGEAAQEMGYITGSEVELPRLSDDESLRQMQLAALEGSKDLQPVLREFAGRCERIAQRM